SVQGQGSPGDCRRVRSTGGNRIGTADRPDRSIRGQNAGGGGGDQPVRHSSVLWPDAAVALSSILNGAPPAPSRAARDGSDPTAFRADANDGWVMMVRVDRASRK